MTNSIRRATALSAALLCASAFFASSHAADCGPLQQVLSVDLIAAPSGVSMLPVTINGTQRKLLLDTAGGLTMLTQTAVDSLGLHAVSSNVRMLDRAGNASARMVTVDSMILGGMEAKNVAFLISPNANLGSNPNLPVDGVLAGDFMEHYDTELDFAGNKMLYFSTDHCDGHVVHWTTAPASAISFMHGRPGVMRSGNDTHIRFHVTLDGKDLLAVLATGSARSTMSARVADTDFKVREDSPGTVPLGNIGGRKVFGYVFKTISFGDVTVTNPHIAVLPDLIGRNDPNNGGRTGSRIGRVDDNLEPDLTIGMDVLKKLHLYIATKEDKLYVTAAEERPATAP